MAIALHHSRAKGTAKLVLVGIANHDGDGGAWPSVKTLAKYASCSVSQVQRSLADLERLGEIRRDIQAGGDHTFASHERPNRYHVLLTCPHDCDRTRNHRTRASQQRILDLDPEQLPGLDDAEGVAPVRPGDTGSHSRDRVALTRPEGVAPVRPKPSSQLTTYLPGDNSSDRARAKAAHSAFCPAPSARRRPCSYEPSGYCTYCATRAPQPFEHPADVSAADPRTGEIS